MSAEVSLCLFGAGGHGRVVAAQLARMSQRPLIFADKARKGDSVDGIPVVFGSIAEVIKAVPDLSIAVTIGDNALRRHLQTKAGQAVAPAIVVEPARVYTDDIGQGSQVLAGAVINIGARIGPGTILNTNTVVEHDCQVGAFCHIAPGAVMGGGSAIGDGVLLGSGAVLLPGVRIVSGAVIGGGALVARDILYPGTWVGVPARYRDGPKP